MIHLHPHGPARAAIEKAHPGGVAFPLQLDVQTPVEAVRALLHQAPALEAVLRDGAWTVTQDGDPQAPAAPLQPGAELHLHREAAGAGDTFKGFLNLVYRVVDAALGLIGIDLPGPPDYSQRDQQENRASYLFDGPVNTISQGGAMPIIFGGPIRVGSVTVSASVYSTLESARSTHRGAGVFDYVSRSTDTKKPTRSSSAINIVDALGEGVIQGLVHTTSPGKSVFVDGVAMQGPRGHHQIPHAINVFTGSENQPHNLFRLPGSGTAVAREISVEQAVRVGHPVIRPIANRNATAVVITIAFPRLTRADNSGNIHSTTVAFDIAWTENPALEWRENRRYNVTFKFTSLAELSLHILFSRRTPGLIRVRRFTPTSTDDKINNEFRWARMTELVSAKLLRPHTAYAALRINSRLWSGRTLRRREYEVKGLIVDVPVNYTPSSRYYNGVWNGAFKQAWTDNGAWIAFHLLKNKRFGLGQDITDAQLSAVKWDFYRIAQFNDTMVPDGKGGHEPRFRCTGVIAKQVDARRAMDQLLGSFNTRLYYGGGHIAAIQDRPEPISMDVGNTNVVDGNFEYTELGHSERYSAVAMSFNDPEDNYKLGIELVVDDDLVKKYGYRQVDKTAIHCTSRGQAQRMARYLLYAQEHESTTITYRAGLDHATLRPGAVVSVQDANFTGHKKSHRVVEAVDEGTRMTTEGGDIAGRLKLQMRTGTGARVEAEDIDHAADSPLPGSTISPTIQTHVIRRIYFGPNGTSVAAVNDNKSLSIPLADGSYLSLEKIEFCAVAGQYNSIARIFFRQDNGGATPTAANTAGLHFIIKFYRRGNGTLPDRNIGTDNGLTQWVSNERKPLQYHCVLPLAAGRFGGHANNPVIHFDKPWLDALPWPYGKWFAGVCRPSAEQYTKPNSGYNRVSFAVVDVNQFRTDISHIVVRENLLKTTIGQGFILDAAIVGADNLTALRFDGPYEPGLGNQRTRLGFLSGTAVIFIGQALPPEECFPGKVINIGQGRLFRITSVTEDGMDGFRVTGQLTARNEKYRVAEAATTIAAT